MTAEQICRIVAAVMPVIGLCIGLPARLRADREGGRVSRTEDRLRYRVLLATLTPLAIVPILLFMVHPPWIRWSQTAAPDWVRYTGIATGFGAMVLFWRMFAHLGTNVTATCAPRDDATLVTTGPYRWIRHPMYTSALLLMTSITLMSLSWFIGLTGLSVVSVLMLRSRDEDARLLEQFGEAYAAYRRRTPAFIPWRRVTADE